MEGADAKKRSAQPALFVSFADLVSVASQSKTGRAGFFRNSLANRSYRSGDDRYGQQAHDQYCDKFRFHYRYTSATRLVTG